MLISVIIVDDEPLARAGIAFYLNKESDIEIIAECENGDQAVKKINSLKPDLVYLDIQMPGLNGFEVIEKVTPSKMPLTIFLTAYNEYATQAFRVNALDYLLKPINQERFTESIERARGELSKNTSSNQGKELKKLLFDYYKESGQKDTKYRDEDRIVIKTAKNVYFISPNDIHWIEANGDYVNIHTKDKTHVLRETLKGMENRLSVRTFQRIHRSCLVCLAQIRELVISPHGDYDVFLMDNTELKLSRHYRDELYEKMQKL